MAKVDATREAWQALLGAHNHLVHRVEESLAAAGLPPLPWHDVLSALDRADGQALRPRDLGCHVAISKSGLTRLLDRIVDAGLVERRACDLDRRGHYVVLTDAGSEMLDRMRPVYDEELGTRFASRITEQEASTLRKVLDRVGKTAPDEAAR